MQFSRCSKIFTLIYDVLYYQLRHFPKSAQKCLSTAKLQKLHFSVIELRIIDQVIHLCRVIFLVALIE